MSAEARFRGFSWKPLGRRKHVIIDFDLTIEAGERVLIAGPSGAGKSTLLYALAGALGTTLAGDFGGEVTADGQIGLLLQNPGDAIVAERIGRDIAFGPENLQLPREEIARRVADALEQVRLPQGAEHFTAALSGGETQRLALAGILAMRPDIFLLDEPTSMLDDETAAAVRESILRASLDSTLVIVDHHIGPWLEHVDRVVVLDRAGAIVGDGTAEHFLRQPAVDGVWMPGMPAPVPSRIPSDLVEPDEEPLFLEAKDLCVDLVTRSLRGTTRTRALDAIDAALPPGTITTFTGPSGAGKSTAVAALGGLLKPSSGELSPDVHRWKSRRLSAAIGWVPQNPEHGFLANTVIDEVERTARTLDRRIDSGLILEVFGLDHLAGANPFRLSGGEQRRLAMAAALAHRPGVVLLDEPTVGQDRRTWSAVTGWIVAAKEAGSAVAASTHDRALPRDADLMMKAGRLI